MENSKFEDANDSSGVDELENEEDGVDASVLKAFRSFDQDGDGTISIAELRLVLGPGGALAEVAGALTNEEIDSLISIADVDGDGEIGYEEFVQLVARMKGGDSEEDLKKAFRYFDIDKDGVISKGDMKVAMKKLGKDFSDNVINQIFEEADDDGDGTVDYDEFVKNVAKKQ